MRVLRINEVIEKTGLSRSTIWRQEINGTFPARRQLSAYSSGWIESEIDQWIVDRPSGTYTRKQTVA